MVLSHIKAEFKVPGGPTLIFEGSLAELKELLVFYGIEGEINPKGKNLTSPTKSKPLPESGRPESAAETSFVEKIVAAIKESTDFDAINAKILQKSSQLDRILLVLYALDKIDENARLGTSQITAVTEKFKIKITQNNVSKTLEKRNNIILTDSITENKSKKYKINVKGIKHIEDITKT